MTKKKQDDAYHSKADRVNISRSGRRKRKKIRDAVVVSSFLVFIAAVAVVCLAVFMKVSFINVENEAIRYTDEQIVEASQIKKEESLLRINRAAVRARLLKSLPYLGTARVRVSLPDSVTISVTYTSAKLCIPAEDGYILLDLTGKVLQTGVAVPSDYVAELRGAEVESAVPGETVVLKDADLLRHVTSLASAFEEHGVSGVTAYDFSDLACVIAEINYYVDVKLGPVQKAAGKLRFGKEVIDRTLRQPRSSSSKLVIDLTGDDSAFVRSQDDIDAVSRAAETRDSELSIGDGTAPDVPTAVTPAGETTQAPVIEAPVTEAPAGTSPENSGGDSVG
jgi:hypothetical protein